MAPHVSPQPLTPGWLSTHFDAQPFPARTTALARYARALAPDAYAALHSALDAGTAHERHTALFLAVARRDLPTVGAALADPVLRRRALSAAIRLPVPEEPLEQLALHPVPAVRHHTYRVLRLGGRGQLAARLLPQVHERYGADDAARLLPACPATTVDTWLPRLDPAHGVLRTLARTAPLAVARLIAERHARLSFQERRSRRFGRHHSALASLAAARDPQNAGPVLVRAVPYLLDGRAVLAVLRHPADVLDALRAARAAGRREGETTDQPDLHWSQLRLPSGVLPPSVRRALRHLSPDDVRELAERCTEGSRRRFSMGRQEVAPDGILLMLAPEERRRVVARRAEARKGGAASLPVSALAALEPADRAALVGVHRERWRSPHRAARDAVALPLHLAEPLLVDLADQHRLHHRIHAWPTLLACAELNGDPVEFARIATLCERAWHDRDEVRRRTLAQLAGAPAHLLAALPRHVLRDAALTAVQSRDSAPATLTAADRLLRRATLAATSRRAYENASYSAGLLCEVLNDPRHPLHAPHGHATSPLRRGGGQRSAHPVPPLPLDAATARALWDAVQADATLRAGQSPALCVPLAELLAPHLARLPQLDHRIHDIALTATDSTLAARAAAAWVTPGALREQRCAELVAQDVSFADVPRVLHTLTTRRTDLLDPVIAAATDGLTGHLRPRASAWAPRIAPSTTGRWLPHQRQALNVHYARVAVAEDVPLHTRADAAARLRTPELLATLADDAPQPVAAAALTALGRAGEPTAGADELSALLLRHAGTGGVRGRAAMAALRQVLATQPTGVAITLLRSVLTTADAPVGTRKEAARALGGLPDAAAFEALLTAWDMDGLHRDVRAVSAPYLMARIDRSDIADRLAAVLDQPALREVVLHTRVPHDTEHGSGPAPPAAAYTAFLVRLLRTTGLDQDTVAAACQAVRLRSAPAPEAVLRALAELVVERDRAPKECVAAAEALGRIVGDGAGAGGAGARAVLPGIWQRLIDRARDGAPSCRTDALRRLVVCADVFGEGGTYDRAGGRTSLRTGGVLDGLADALETVGLHTRAFRLRRDLLAVALRRGEYRPERWGRLLRAMGPEQTALASERDGGPWHCYGTPPTAFLTAARELREHGTQGAARIALALVRVGGLRSSWSDEWRAELDALRHHEDPETALEAWWVAPHSGGRGA